MDTSNYRAVVVIAVDDTEAAEYAFNWYKDFIHREDYFTVLVHTMDHDAQEIRDSSPGRTAKIMKEMTADMKTIEEKYGYLMDLRNMKGKIRKGLGKPGETICKVACEEGATMIITGSRGLGKIKRTFLGSVSDYVVHHAHCPVITCKAH